MLWRKARRIFSEFSDSTNAFLADAIAFRLFRSTSGAVTSSKAGGLLTKTDGSEGV